MIDPVRTANLETGISIIIPTRNRWSNINVCLKSILRQKNSPSYEVIIVDDGSTVPAPDSLISFKKKISLKIITQIHLGVSTARNRGICEAKKEILLFVDSDCILKSDCLYNLFQTVKNNPDKVAFQMRITGNMENLIGKAECVYNKVIIEKKRIDVNHLIYLDTTGFAIRKSWLHKDQELFNVVALRAQDTFLLYELVKQNIYPFYVQYSTVIHDIDLSLIGYIKKSFRSCYDASRTFSIIKKRDKKVTFYNRDRMMVLLKMINQSLINFHSLIPFLIIVLKYISKIFGKLAFMFIGVHLKKSVIGTMKLYPYTAFELKTLIANSVYKGKKLTIALINYHDLLQQLFHTASKKYDFSSYDICCLADPLSGLLLSIAKLKIWKYIKCRRFINSIIDDFKNFNISITKQLSCVSFGSVLLKY